MKRGISVIIASIFLTIVITLLALAVLMVINNFKINALMKQGQVIDIEKIRVENVSIVGNTLIVGISTICHKLIGKVHTRNSEYIVSENLSNTLTINNARELTNVTIYCVHNDKILKASLTLCSNVSIIVEPLSRVYGDLAVGAYFEGMYIGGAVIQLYNRVTLLTDFIRDVLNVPKVITYVIDPEEISRGYLLHNMSVWLSPRCSSEYAFLNISVSVNVSRLNYGVQCLLKSDLNERRYTRNAHVLAKCLHEYELYAQCNIPPNITFTNFTIVTTNSVESCVESTVFSTYLLNMAEFAYRLTDLWENVSVSILMTPTCSIVSAYYYPTLRAYVIHLRCSAPWIYYIQFTWNVSSLKFSTDRLAIGFSRTLIYTLFLPPIVTTSVYINDRLVGTVARDTYVVATVSETPQTLTVELGCAMFIFVPFITVDILEVLYDVTLVPS